MTCGFQDKSFAFTLLVTYAYRMHIQDGGKHVAFHQNNIHLMSAPEGNS